MGLGACQCSPRLKRLYVMFAFWHLTFQTFLTTSSSHIHRAPRSRHTRTTKAHPGDPGNQTPPTEIALEPLPATSESNAGIRYLVVCFSLPFSFFLFLFGRHGCGLLFACYYRIMIGVCLFRGLWAVRERERDIFPGITNTTLGTKSPRRSQHILRRPSRFKYLQQAPALSALRLRSYRF